MVVLRAPNYYGLYEVKLKGTRPGGFEVRVGGGEKAQPYKISVEQPEA